MFIVLTGPDGVGKTTVARSILDKAGDASRYFHFIPDPALLPNVPEEASLIEKNRETGSRLLGVLRILRNLARAWVAYFRAIRPAVRAGSLVVGDRWLYGYVTQPLALKFYGPAWLARIALRAMPRPDMTVLLEAPVQLIHQRKPELSPREIEAETHLLTLAIPDAVVMDATRDPAAIAEDVIRRARGGRGFRKYPPLLGQVLLPAVPRSHALAGSTLYTPARTRGMAAQRVGRGLIRVFGTFWLEFASPQDIPLDAGLREGLLSFLSDHQIEPDTLAFHVRPQARRQGFAVLLITNGRTVGFVRVGSRGTLDVECQALELLERRETSVFRSARLIGRTAIEDVEFALHSPVLDGYHKPPKDPPLDLIVREIKDALTALPRPSSIPAHWEPIHGDLTPWNLRLSKAGLCLIDWESAGWGPPHADQMLYMATSRALGRRPSSGDWEAEAAAFWLERTENADNPRDTRLRRGVVAILKGNRSD